MPRINADRAAVRGNFLDVKHRQAVRLKYVLNGNQGEVREMLVVDGVVLVLLHQPAQVRKLERHDSFRFQHDLNAAHEIVQVRHLRQHVIADDKVRPLSVPHHFAGGGAAEELDQGWNAFFDRHLGHVCGRLDSQSGNAFPDKVLEQVPVVACQFHRQALFAKLEARDDHLHIIRSVFQPRVRIGRKIGVFGEDVLGADKLVQLDQITPFADPHVERIKRLHLIQLFESPIAFAQRRHPEVNKRLLERTVAEAAAALCVAARSALFRRLDDGVFFAHILFNNVA